MAEDDMLNEAIRRSLIDAEHGGYSDALLYNNNEDSGYQHQILTEREIMENSISSYVIPTNQRDLEAETGIKMQKQIMASPGQMWMDCLKESFEDKWLNLHPEY